MKLYSHVYADTLLSASELEAAKLALINVDGRKLHEIIDREANKSAAKYSNKIKAIVGTKPRTPMTICALSDLYQTSAFMTATGQPMAKQPAHNPWQAARLFADNRSALVSPNSSSVRLGTQSTSRTSRSSSLSMPSRQGSVSSTKSLQFSDTHEEIPAGPWRLSSKKQNKLMPLSVLTSEDRATFVKRAQKSHHNKALAAGALEGFSKLKYVI